MLLTIRILLAVLAAVSLAISPLSAQEGPKLTPEQKRLLMDIHKGKIQVSDELIESQKQLHPEMGALSNDQIKKMLYAQANKLAQEEQGKEEEEDASRKEEEEEETGRKAKEKAGRKKESAETREDAQEEAAAKSRNRAEETGTTGRFPAGLKRFGYDFFANGPSGNAAGNTPALPDYVLSPGDELQIYTWGRENKNQKVFIDNEGMILVAPLPPMRLAGMRFSEAQQLLIREIEKIAGVKASVGLGKLKSIRVFVLGEVASPGSYVVPAGATVTSALFQSGGITDIGSLRAIQLKRNDKIIATLDLYGMLLKGNSRSDVQMLPGDAIFVPVAPIQIAVTGMVKRPGVYEVRSGTKVLEALELAGGLSSNAFKGRVRLDRVESHKRKVVLDIGMEKMAGNANANLQDGDILNVDEVLAREYDVVYLSGNVNRPGRYEYKKGMNIRDLIPGVKDLKSGTFFTYGHIRRSSDDDQGSLLLPFSLKEVFENGVEVPLMPRDTVLIYSQYDIMDVPQVRISGNIRRPGTYPFVDRMRVSDLIILGGGLTETSHLREAHLIRILRTHESDSLFSTLLKVDLTHLIDNPGDENNVELRPSDSLLIFPRSNFLLRKEVAVSGGVKRGGVFELTENMGIPELISQANGLTKNTYKLQIEVVRRTVERDSVVRRTIHRLSLNDVIEGKRTFPLQDGDAIYIREAVDNHSTSTINLSGEFNFPGTYEFGQGERLSSVIRRAGGYTNAAYLRAAVFKRKAVKERQLEAVEDLDRRLQSQLTNLMAQTTSEKDKASIQSAISQRKVLLEEIKEAPYLGRVVLNLDRGYKFEGTDEDITLENGDSLFIRSTASTISILGEVFSPTNVIVTRNVNTISACLRKAGGVNEYGDKKNVFYIQPDGSVLSPKSASFFFWRKVEPGGIIIVPPKGPRKDYLDGLSKITQIIYQIAISVGVAKTLF